MSAQCFCGGHYRCEDCRHDVCFCTCQVDGAALTQPVAGYVNPSTARLNAWAEKLELTR